MKKPDRILFQDRPVDTVNHVRAVLAFIAEGRGLDGEDAWSDEATFGRYVILQSLREALEHVEGQLSEPDAPERATLTAVDLPPEAA